MPGELARPLSKLASLLAVLAVADLMVVTLVGALSGGDNLGEASLLGAQVACAVIAAVFWIASRVLSAIAD